MTAIAVLPVRDGVLPLGANETVAEAGGNALFIGSGTKPAAAEPDTLRRGWRVEAGEFAPGSWARSFHQVRSACQAPTRILLPASPDGRDLAPRLAFELGMPLLAGAVEVTEWGARLARWDSRVLEEVTAGGPFVATLIPGARSTRPVRVTPEITELSWTPEDGMDAEVLEILPPDPRTADLAEAPRILGAGAGLTRGADPAGTEAVNLLQELGEALSASVGATRVVTDAGFADYQRQIGTTGVLVNPELYIAFGISGATQHIGGLGAPEHVVSVNTDPSCPMTAMADLGIVADATEVLVELARRLETKEAASG